MAEEIHCGFTDGDIMAQAITAKRYSFCFINLEKAELWDNFSTLMYSRDTDPLLNH
jgi:hypothetical protein